MDKVSTNMKTKTRSHSTYNSQTFGYETNHTLLLKDKRVKCNQHTKTNNPEADFVSESCKVSPKATSKESPKGEKDVCLKCDSSLQSKQSEMQKIIITSKEDVKAIDPNVGLESKSDQIYNNHMKITFLSLQAIRSLTCPSLPAIKSKQITLVRPPGCERRKTIIFDLDETLVHCVGCNKGDIALPIEFPSGKVMITGINIRPFAVECLQEANKLFEVVVFTASYQCYADVILDYLDPRHSLIHHRLYREHCLKVGNCNVKDLRIFENRRVQDMFIIDNSVFSFAFHLDNGVPIISWYNDRDDKELNQLVEYFKIIEESEDVREINRQIFHLDSFYDDFKEEFTSR